MERTWWDRHARHVGTGFVVLWYAVVAFLGIAWAQEWADTPRAVTATLTDCRWNDPTDPKYGVTCTYTWTVNGRTWTKDWKSSHLYDDGHRAEVWTNPDTGRLSQHSLLLPGWGLFVAIVGPAVFLVSLRRFNRDSPSYRTFR
ncbi:hypothetical protein ACPC54_25760 [Kitasatospora sp. NPDC094028]